MVFLSCFRQIQGNFLKRVSATSIFLPVLFHAVIRNHTVRVMVTTSNILEAGIK